MERILLFICLLLIVNCVASTSNKVRPPLRNATKKNTEIVTEKAAIYWQAEFCIGVPDKTYFPNDDGCEYFWMCMDENLESGRCPEDMYFDSLDLVCDSFEFVTCWEPEITEKPITPDPEPESECPTRGSTEIVFLPSINCNEYYICHNGVPNLFFCRPGSHWNAIREFCDLPANAGCTDVGPDTPLPECRMGFIGSVPHPWNCNWFVFCSNGNRSIQQCPHLQHFDVDLGRCLILTEAKCIND